MIAGLSIPESEAEHEPVGLQEHDHCEDANAKERAAERANFKPMAIAMQGSQEGEGGAEADQRRARKERQNGKANGEPQRNHNGVGEWLRNTR